MRNSQPSSDQRGEISVLIVPLIIALVLLLGAIGFGAWAYTGRQDFKNNSDQKIAAAVQVARQQEGIDKDKQHAEADKQPLTVYKGPEQFGSVTVAYPKTWSAYIVTNNSVPLNGYFQPGIVPDVADNASVFALRVQVINQPYNTVTAPLNGQVKPGGLTAVPYAFPKVPDTVGIRYEGVYDNYKKTQGTLIVVPLRDKTLEISTESPAYANDFAAYILPNVTFSP